MNCSDFQTNLDPYLDDELEDSVKRLATRHVTSCRTCDTVVTDHQKARALLVTAVTDRVAAVDLSGLWRDVEGKLDRQRAAVVRLDERRARSSLFAGSASLRTPLRLGAFAAAAAAAIFAFAMSGGGEQAPSGSGAIMQSRPARIDSMEVAAGHSVSTWVKPRTRTRVIWVANTGGFSVSNASHSR